MGGDPAHMDGFDVNVRAYYERGIELDRLQCGVGLLEEARTKELITRHVPQGGDVLDVIDIGGGGGHYARWLAQLGHRVTLVDPIPLHVDHVRRTSPGVTAVLGDARAVPASDEAFDVALLLGPLYHLTKADDRARALAEVKRCLRPGGLLFAAVISRYAALLDLLLRKDLLHEDGVVDVVRDGIAAGVFAGAERGLFTTAYFHLPSEVIGEVSDAGFARARLFNIEGPGAFAHDVEERWRDPARRQTLLDAARLVEEDQYLLAASSHLLVVATAPTF